MYKYLVFFFFYWGTINIIFYFIFQLSVFDESDLFRGVIALPVFLFVSTWKCSAICFSLGDDRQFSVPKVSGFSRAMLIPMCDLVIVTALKTCSKSFLWLWWLWQISSQALYSLHRHAEVSQASEGKTLFQRNHILKVKSIKEK